MVDVLYSNDRAGEHPNSYYHATAHSCPNFPCLDQDQHTSVCVIGAGYTGLSSALHLAKKGIDVILIDAHRISWGASGRNGGQVCTGQRQDQHWLEKKYGKSQAKSFWEIAEAGKALVRSLIQEYSIQCNYQQGIISAELRETDVPETHNYAQWLMDNYGYDKIKPLSQSEISERIGTDIYKGGIQDMGAGHLHPLNFGIGLAKACHSAGVRIFEQTEVLDIQGTHKLHVKCPNYIIHADHVVLACNGYLRELNHTIAPKVMPINNYVVATEPLGKAYTRSLIRDNVAVDDSKFVVNYYRISEDHRLIFGGGENSSYNFVDDIRNIVRVPMLETFPQLKDAKIDYAWGGTLAITMNRMPVFARPKPNIYSASGYSGHGVAMAIMAGKLIADAVHGDVNGFDVMATVKHRQFPGGTKLRQPLLKLAMAWYGLRDRL